MNTVTASGVVREWRSEEGWGVIESASTPGGCWAHFGALLVPGIRSLVAGQRVSFEFLVVQQDGFRYRATEVWPEGLEPERMPVEMTGPSAGYSSSLTITVDPADEQRQPPQG